MTADQKEQIRTEILFRAKKTSQRHLAVQLKVSTALITQIKKRNWKLISNGMWRKLKTKLGINDKWNVVETSTFQGLWFKLKSAQEQKLSIAFQGIAGKGKTTTYKAYARQNPETIYLECQREFNTTIFIKELCNAAGIEANFTGYKNRENFVDAVLELENPIIILDQYDKLKPTSQDIFHALFDDLEDHCAFFISGVKAFEKQILRRVKRNKEGYEEIYSRMSRDITALDKPLTKKDIQLICEANGVNDSDFIDDNYKLFVGDIRPLKKKIIKEQMHIKAKQSA